MPKQISKSRTFAVILSKGDTFGVYFLWVKKDMETGKENLEYQTQDLNNWADTSQKDGFIELLKKAGLTVRFYEDDEKQWMDSSLVYGLVPAPGSRDGQWSFPNLEAFKEHYLGTV